MGRSPPLPAYRKTHFITKAFDTISLLKPPDTVWRLKSQLVEKYPYDSLWMLLTVQQQQDQQQPGISLQSCYVSSCQLLWRKKVLYSLKAFREQFNFWAAKTPKEAGKLTSTPVVASLSFLCQCQECFLDFPGRCCPSSLRVLWLFQKLLYTTVEFWSVLDALNVSFLFSCWIWQALSDV